MREVLDTLVLGLVLTIVPAYYGRAETDNSLLLEVDRATGWSLTLPAGQPLGEASIREHAITWHPRSERYFLIADVVPVASEHHPNTYDTELHLWSSPDLQAWQHHGVAVPRGKRDEDYDGYGVASPAGLVVHDGRLFVAFSARRNARFEKRDIGLAWSSEDPTEVPWSKSPQPISGRPDSEDDDPAVMTIPGDPRLHLFYRATSPGGYHIVHAASQTPRDPASWSPAGKIGERPDAVRAQELTGAVWSDGRVNLFIIEHRFQGGIAIAHLVATRPEGPFASASHASRYLGAESQAEKLAYSGHITPFVKKGRIVGCSWTVQQQGQRYGLRGHSARLVTQESDAPSGLRSPMESP